MHIPQLSRVEIYRQIRVILVRRLIDIGRLCIVVTGSRIHVKGSLQFLPGVAAAMTPGTVQEIFKEIRSIRSITAVDASLDNWMLTNKITQTWVPIQAAQTTEARESAEPTILFGCNESS